MKPPKNVVKKITKTVAKRVLKTIDAGLVSGVGRPVPGQMCVEAAVCYALGLPHGDDPGCVSRSLRALKIRLNDSGWSSDQARAVGLRRLGLAQLGSVGVLDNAEFATRVVVMTVRKILPIVLRLAGLETNAVECEAVVTLDEAKKAAADAATDAARAAHAAHAVGDEVLSLFAENVVQILIDMKAPGCQWLYLTE